MPSRSAQNSFVTKLSNFFRGVVVFLFLISIPVAALYWDEMPAGIKSGFQWLHAKIHHSESQSEDPFHVEIAPESIWESSNVRIFSENNDPRTNLPENSKSVSPFFPIQQVSHNPTAQPLDPITQTLSQSEIPEQELLIQNFGIQNLEHEIKRLGASQCRLESWGNEGRLYRFSCFAPPVPGQHGFQKHFQQIAATPEDAMKKVQIQLIDWQNREQQR